MNNSTISDHKKCTKLLIYQLMNQVNSQMGEEEVQFWYKQ